MDDSEIARTIVKLALSQMDLNQLVGGDFSASDAEALGRKLGNFYQGFYRGVLAALRETGQTAIETDEAKLGDAVHTRGGLGAPARATGKPVLNIKKSKLNDVVHSKGPVPRKKER